MTDGEVSTQYATRQLRGVPVDLSAIVLYVVAVDAAIVFGVTESIAARTTLGIPLLFFVPGYVLLAMLFPGRAGAPSGISLGRRVALSFGTSVALLPIFGVGLGIAPVSFGLIPTLSLLTAFVLSGVLVAAVRRRQCPDTQRFSLPLRSRARSLRDRSAVGLLDIALAVSILVACVTVGYAVTVPNDGESFTEFYVAGDDDLTDGESVPEFTRGEEQTVTLGIENKEGERTNYTVVVLLQETDSSGDTATVEAEHELDRVEHAIEDEDHRAEEHAVEPPITGTELRLRFLLYKESLPDDPSVETADQHLHLWIDVTDGDDDGG